MIRVTLDTNILVSGTFWTGDSYRILELIDKKKITSILSKEIIAEYINTVISEEITEKIENKKLIAAKTAQKVVMMSEIVEPTRKIDRIKEDPEDNKILECATTGKAGYIITNDNHLLNIKGFEGIKILTPRQFLEE
ncbi:TPA: putative toxin-antitoxin system toxin component, PIN family [Candidatus Woesearchaeota archaeon]|nr:putative toxin-antitoxin system toxin component, PIN family [Candidatus Woesearchaeota archaeon]